jgi:hypothetical protein
LSTHPENDSDFCRIFFKKKLKLIKLSFFFRQKSMNIKKTAPSRPGCCPLHPMEEADII